MGVRRVCHVISGLLLGGQCEMSHDSLARNGELLSSSALPREDPNSH